MKFQMINDSRDAPKLAQDGNAETLGLLLNGFLQSTLVVQAVHRPREVTCKRRRQILGVNLSHLTSTIQHQSYIV
jgi:hypothetical protein